MEWDTVGRSPDVELSSNCLTATKTSSSGASTVRGTILYNDMGVHEFHVILDSLGPDGIWVGVASPDMDPAKCVGDIGCGWALHSDGDRRFNGREEEFTSECNPVMWLAQHTPLLQGRMGSVFVGGASASDAASTLAWQMRQSRRTQPVLQEVVLV
jgi:hypothetical protein